MNYIGDGYYKISPVLAPDKALEVKDCLTASGANVQIGNYEEEPCQHWYVAYMGSGGTYRIMAAHSARALDVTSLDIGANVRQRSYDEDLRTERWRFKTPTIIESVSSTSDQQNGFKMYPNPSGGSFIIDLSQVTINGTIQLEILSLDGKRVYSQMYTNSKTIAFTDKLSKGIYLVNITTKDRVLTQKLIVN